jgi:hypothetical protein
MSTTTITWIPVAERLPDDDTTVLLALADGDVITGWHEGGDSVFPREWRDVTGWQITQGVTHWADLPAAPEVKP